MPNSEQPITAHDVAKRENDAALVFVWERHCELKAHHRPLKLRGGLRKRHCRGSKWGHAGLDKDWNNGLYRLRDKIYDGLPAEQLAAANADFDDMVAESKYEEVYLYGDDEQYVEDFDEDLGHDFDDPVDLADYSGVGFEHLEPDEDFEDFDDASSDQLDSQYRFPL